MNDSCLTYNKDDIYQLMKIIDAKYDIKADVHNPKKIIISSSPFLSPFKPQQLVEEEEKEEEKGAEEKRRRRATTTETIVT